MENTLNEKIKIGISACMYGAKVRYNSKGFDILGYLKREKNDFLWTPVCPEVMSGLSVPRSSIRLVGGNGFDFWERSAQVKNRSGKNVSGMIRAGSMSCFETLKRVDVDAYIFMEGSPSCGINRTTLRKESLGKPPGVFGALLLKEQMFLIPALDLQSPLKWWDWKRRLVAFTWFKRKELNTFSEFFECWDILKILCQEIDEESSKGVEESIEFFSDKTNPKEFEKIQIEILDILRTPSNPIKIKKWLWENYNSLKKIHSIEVDKVREPEYLRGVTHVANEMLQVELEARKVKKCFKSSPIDYAPGR
ncbi:MAG: DUF523 domain-containing protein [Psychrilyobacter sp.]|uniref:DUF523 domain-containing protein n=1 Tax=Psychrilyobacter sp. TaxID=2586924 RepID=UPI003C709D7B